MATGRALFLAAAITLALHSPQLAAQNLAAPPASARIAIETPRDLTPGAVLDDAGQLPFPVAVRIVADDLGPPLFPEDRVEAAASRRAPIWLVVPAPARVEDIEAWRAALSAVIGRHGRTLSILEITVGDQPAAVAGFAVRLAATEVRAAPETSIRLAVGGPRFLTADGRAEVYNSDVAPYVDLLAVPAFATTVAEAWLTEVDPGAALIVTQPAGSGATETRRAVVDAVLRSVGTRVTLVALAGGSTLAPALRALAPVAALLTHDLSELDRAGASLRLTLDGTDASETVPHRLLFDNETFGIFLAYWGASTTRPLDVSIQLTVEGSPVLQHLVAGTETPAEGATRDAATRTTRLRVPVTGEPMLVDFNRNAAGVFTDRGQVTAAVGLSVAEIIARHQARQRAQDVLVRNYIARAHSEQHFRPTAADPGYDIVSANRYFVSGADSADVEWEELEFFVNGSRWGPDRPPFPLLQPEKVLSLPLQLRFDEGYRYRLAGTERVAGYECYVVRFEPVRQDAALYRGTIWIDRETFARVRVHAVQAGLTAPVVSNDEALEYAPPVMVGGQPVHLLTEVTARQIVLIAGRNLLVEKRVQFDEIRVNDAGFDTEREAARRSDRVMFRETPAGLRYYVKEGDRRVVVERPTLSARAMALGVTLDPSYAFPLPIFGINYLDFEFGGPDAQLALLFGGVLAAGNVQFPNVGRTPFDASIDFFAIAVPSSDRLYDASAERPSERLLTWPMTGGVNLGWQYTPFQKVTGHYQVRFDAFKRETTTGDEFTLPSSTVTNGIGASWEYRRGGYSLLLTGTESQRVDWRPWGLATGVDGAPADGADRSRYARYGGSLSRDFYFNVFHKIHLNAAWFGGRDLDRFSKYQFGLFDETRLHGVPASGIRFTDLAMVRGSYSLNIFEQYRLDLFLERAWGRDREIDRRWQPVTGLGVAVNLRGPKSTMLRVDFGKSLLPDRYRTVGSYNLQILVLKPLR